MSDQQIQMLAEFRSWINEKGPAMGADNPWFDDAWLLRFCRARKFELHPTIDMWSNFMAFRHEHHIDQICIEFPAEIDATYLESLTFYPRGFVGVDKIGRPVHCERVGSIKVDKFFKLVPEERMFRGLYHMFEHCIKHRFLACSAVFDRQIHQTVNLFDLAGFGLFMWNKANMNLFKSVMRVQDLYPEMMGKLIICNAPMLFSAVYAVLKGWIDEKTRKKISICGSWSTYKTLSEYIDDD